MTVRSTLSAYVPNHSPTWTEVVLTVLVLVVIAPDFLSPSTLSWPAVAVGFAAFAVALGPAASSSVGTGIGTWFRDIGVTGRAAVIVLFAVAVGVTSQRGAVPSAAIADVGSGGLLAVVLYTTVHIVSAGDVSGWTPNRECTE